MSASRIVVLAILALAFYHASATDPSQLQDFCVADLESNIYVNGFVCKNPENVTVDDFWFSGLNKPGNTSNSLGSMLTRVGMKQIPGLNTLGLALGRVDYAPNGLFPPHVHPRATEIVVLLEGTLFVGFVTSNPENRFFGKALKPGDVFVFPQGLIHFQYNPSTTRNAVTFAGVNSQNPGLFIVTNALFGSKPRIGAAVLKKALKIDDKMLERLLANFANCS